MQKPTLDLGLTSDARMRHVLQIASLAQSPGVHGIWIGEDIGRGLDVFVQASMLLLRSFVKNIGIGVTSPMLRNISTLARAAAAISEIDPARFRLGLGVGGLQDLARLGLTVEKPVAMLKETIDVLRRIWTGETLTMRGEGFELRHFIARYKPSSGIPLYLGVRGPQLLRLAGRVADGVILSGPLGYIEKALEIVRAEAIARPLRTRLRTVVWLPTLVVRKKADKDLARVVAATVIADTPPAVLEMGRIPDSDVKNVREKARERNYIRASRQVSDELLDKFLVSGDATRIAEVLRSLGKLGADEVVFGPPYGADMVHSIREVIGAWERL